MSYSVQLADGICTGRVVDMDKLRGPPLFWEREMNNLLKFFKYEHLPERLKPVSKACCELATKMDELPESAEKTAGLRKLLEAKDCFVRAQLEDDAKV